MGNLKKMLFGVFKLIPALLFCQEDISSQVKYGALTQIHLSYAENDSSTNPNGFRLRPIDFKVWKPTDNKISWGLLLGFWDFKFQILEADVDFKIKEEFQIRVGYFFEAAYRFGLLESSLRYNLYSPNHTFDEFGVKSYKNHTIGLNIYPVNKVKLQFNYIYRAEELETIPIIK
jgi:hypothetical protein